MNNYEQFLHMAVHEFWYFIIAFVMAEQSYMFTIYIFLGLGGRLIYTISSLLYYRFILNTNLKTLGKKFWIRFAFTEIFLIALSIPFDFLSTGILAYSLLTSSQMLRAKSENNNIVFRIFGILLGPIAYIGSVITLILSLFGLVGGEQLINPLIGCIIAGLIYIITKQGFPKILDLESFTLYMKRSGWNKLNKTLKIIVVVVGIITPALLIGSAYLIAYPRSELYMVSMADGTELKTRVWFPAGWDNDPKPVILSRTPYDLEYLSNNAFGYILEHDCIFVGQDLRGTHGSEGDFYGFQAEYTDGNETVNWILEQEWCNGKIISIGGSALALNQICYHPSLQNGATSGLKAASLLVGSSEMYEYGLMIGGCLRQGLSENWLIPVSGKSDAIDKLMENPMKNEQWDNMSLETNNRYENIDVRAVHTGGWYDMFCQGTIDAFQLYNQGTEYAQDHQFLVMGPWYHGTSYTHTTKSITKQTITYPDTNGTSYWNTLENSLIKEYFFGEEIDWDNIPRVYYYVMGDPDGENSEIEYNYWRTADSWPIANTPEKWYFHPNGTLSTNIPESGEVLSFLYDPRDPVRNGGGTTLTLDYIGAVDQRRVEYTEPFGTTDRNDILKFTSDTLTAPIEIIGNITTELYIQSNCTDTDFTAKLMDIYPDGREMWIADGILKARYRDAEDFDSETFMDGSQSTIYDLNIDMWSTAYRFIPGHQIRVSITSSNFNKFAVNPNTGTAVESTHPVDCTSLGTNFYIANNSIACGISGSESGILFPRTL